MIQNVGLQSGYQAIAQTQQVAARSVQAQSAPQERYSISQSYYKNQLPAKDLNFVKSFSNQMSTLYGAATKLQNQKGNESADKIEKNTKEFVDKFNESVDFLEKNKGKNKTLNRLHDSLTSVGKTYEKSLQDIGIGVGSDGKLAIDETKFKESLTASPDRVKDTLSTLAKKTEDFAMRGINTSSQSLLAESSNKLQNVMDEETYYAGIRKMASNAQFMNMYYSAQATFNMINLFA